VTADEDIGNNCPKSLRYANSKFIYQPCDLVLTGDVNIVQEKEVKRFLQKGLKYHPSSKINRKS